MLIPISLMYMNKTFVIKAKDDLKTTENFCNSEKMLWENLCFTSSICSFQTLTISEESPMMSPFQEPPAHNLMHLQQGVHIGKVQYLVPKTNEFLVT